MATENEVKDDLKVKELEDGSIQVGEIEDEGMTSEEGSGEDTRLAQDSDTEDEQGHAEESAEEAEARRQRNRERRAQNKASRKEYIESLKRELAARDSLINDLSTRVASVEQHSLGNQVAQLDAAIQEAAGYYNHFKEVNRKAIELADGATAVDAQEKMFAAQNRHQMLLNAKKNLAATATQPRPLDPRMVENAASWIERNPWYDPSGSDADSDLVMKLDARLIREGKNPTTQEYWDELDARVKKYLPHRAEKRYNEGKGARNSPPRTPVSGSGGESATPSKGGYRLSAERVAALKESGAYDDPVKLADAIKRYKEYDRTHGQSV